MRNEKGQFVKGGKVSHSEETRKKISESHKGKILSEEHKKNLSVSHKGQHSSIKTQFFKGQKPWNTGKNRPAFSDEWKENIRKSLKGKYIGEKHWNWNGGITTIRTLLWHSDKYQSWRNAIFLKDNYICQICGIKNGDGKTIPLEADHYPVPFAFYLEQIKKISNDKFKWFEIALQFQPLWKSTGRTLCKFCHNYTKKGCRTLSEFIKMIISLNVSLNIQKSNL